VKICLEICKAITAALQFQNTKREVNKQKYTGTQCLTYIQPNMCVKVKVQEDPATTTTLTAITVEQKNSKKCK
jgi:hypothetical protein